MVLVVVVEDGDCICALSLFGNDVLNIDCNNVEYNVNVVGYKPVLVGSTLLNNLLPLVVNVVIICESSINCIAVNVDNSICNILYNSRCINNDDDNDKLLIIITNDCNKF